MEHILPDRVREQIKALLITAGLTESKARAVAYTDNPIPLINKIYEQAFKVWDAAVELSMIVEIDVAQCCSLMDNAVRCRTVIDNYYTTV